MGRLRSTRDGPFLASFSKRNLGDPPPPGGRGFGLGRRKKAAVTGDVIVRGSPSWWPDRPVGVPKGARSRFFRTLRTASDRVRSTTGEKNAIFIKNPLDEPLAIVHHDPCSNPRPMTGPDGETDSMRRQACRATAVAIVMSAVTLSFVAAFPAQESPRFAGPTNQGFLLPNGWTLKPAGEQVPLADLPLNILPLADNRHVLAATSGYNAHELT